MGRRRPVGRLKPMGRRPPFAHPFPLSSRLAPPVCIGMVLGMPTHSQQEGYASSTAMLRRHDYGDATLRSRFFLAMARPLFAKGRAQQKLATLRHQVERLRAKQPHRVKGRHTLIRDMLQMVKRKRAAGVFSDKQMGKKAIAHANRAWKETAPETKRHYEAEAFDHCAATRQKIASELSERMASIKLWHARADDDDAGDAGPIRMSKCAFSLAELDPFDDRWQQMGRRDDLVGAFEMSQAEPVGKPPALLKTAMENQAIPEEPRRSRRYGWVAPICTHREEFAMCGVQWTGGGCFVLGVCMFAMQRPYIVGFLAAEATSSRSGASSSSSSAAVAPPPSQARHLLQLRLGHWLFSDEDHWPENSSVAILPNLCAIGGGFLASDAEWTPLQKYLDSLPAPSAPISADSATDRVTKRKRKIDKSVLSEHPWLIDHCCTDSRAPRPKLASSSGNGGALAR